MEHVVDAGHLPISEFGEAGVTAVAHIIEGSIQALKAGAGVCIRRAFSVVSCLLRRSVVDHVTLA